jgi:hypothetical protein
MRERRMTEVIYSFFYSVQQRTRGEEPGPLGGLDLLARAEGRDVFVAHFFVKVIDDDPCRSNVSVK